MGCGTVAHSVVTHTSLTGRNPGPHAAPFVGDAMLRRMNIGGKSGPVGVEGTTVDVDIDVDVDVEMDDDAGAEEDEE